jgi:hypothetical protein
MQITDAKKIHSLLSENRWQEAADSALSLIGKPSSQKTHAQCVGVLRSLFQFLLDSEDYLSAATLQWGPEMFNTEPECVKRVFEALKSNSKILFQGASSMGKSYNAGVWMYLDWRRDPLYTSIKCVGVSEDQVRKHVFAHIVKLHRACAIPMVEQVLIRESDMWMGVTGAGNEFGITAIAYKQSQETSGGIKGYKSMAVRTRRHPKFGYMSRLRLLGDEGQNWPGGPFKDMMTWVSQIDGVELVKIAIAFNPESQAQHVVNLAKPDQGWLQEDVETLYDWTSKAGWRVCRLDAAKSENVIQKKRVYFGLQSYEGYIGYLKSGGDASSDYYCFGRGFPPLTGSINTIIPPAWPQQARGEAIFIDNPMILGSVDLAFMGKDTAQMAVARWGLASGWRDHMNKYHPFIDRLNIKLERPRHVLQIDQLLPMQKHDDTVRMGEEIMGRARMLGIKPENLIVDKTSIGLGVHSHLNKVWGASRGVSWNEKSTSQKILSEDLDGAETQCDGIMSEMWWTFRRWIDPTCCAILLNPIIPTQPLFTELTSRRYSPAKSGKIKVEPKDAYKARNSGASPDEADACIMLTLLVRQNGDVLPGLVEQQTRNTTTEGAIRFETVGKIITHEIDKDDSLSEDGSEKEEALS